MYILFLHKRSGAVQKCHVQLSPTNVTRLSALRT